MQEFLTNQTVSWNLMSLTGYRTLVILDALTKSPKTIEEINDYLFDNKYIKERFSSDTIRLYVNSLRAVGCEITRATKTNQHKFTLISHPFTYEIPKSQLIAITKLYKNYFDKINIEDLIKIENLFTELKKHITDENSRIVLTNLSSFQKIDSVILKELIIHCKKKNQIVLLYNSPKSGEKEIELIADKIKFDSGKLYLYGENLTHKEYSYFSVRRIKKICNIKLHKNPERIEPQKIRLEIYDTAYELSENERLISKSPNKIIIETIVKNEFFFTQKILSMANNCKIIEPENYRNKIISKLKLMEQQYENI